MRMMISALVLFVSAHAVPLQAHEINTALGARALDANPQSVAVFDIAAIDTLHALGVSIAGVPNNLYLEKLETELSDIAVIGSLFEPDLEALNALDPDLIIVGGRSSTQLEQTQRVAPTIDMTIWGDDMIEQSRQRIIDYGILFNKTSQAARLLNAFDEAITRAKQAIANKGKGLIVMTNGPKISVYGVGSRFGWLHSTLGLLPTTRAQNAGTHGDAVSFEFVADVNPDWLIVIDRASAIGSGEQSAKATLDNELIHQTEAWKNGKVVYLPSSSIYIAAGGAHATINVLNTLSAAFEY